MSDENKPKVIFPEDFLDYEMKLRQWCIDRAIEHVKGYPHPMPAVATIGGQTIGGHPVVQTAQEFYDWIAKGDVEE